MTAALWLGTYVLHSTVLYVVVLPFRQRLRRVTGGEYVWRAALLVPLVSTVMVGLLGESSWVVTVPIAPVTLGSVGGAGERWATLLVSAWVVVGAMLLVRDWIAHRVFVRRLGPRRPAGAAIAAQVRDLLAHERFPSPIQLTVALGASSPVVLGRTEICLPVRAVQELTPLHLRALVAHEVAHILRSDGRWLALVAALESAMFVQPLNRMASQELRFLAEVASDGWAARRIADPLAVAHGLVTVAGWWHDVHPATVPAATSGSLSERVQRLIEPSAAISHLPVGPFLGVLIVVALALPGLAERVEAQVGEFADSVDYRLGYEIGQQYAVQFGRQDLSADSQSVARSRAQRAALERRLKAAGGSPR